MPRLLLLLAILSVSLLGQPSKADRFSVNSREFAGVIPYGAVSGNVTTNGSGVMTVTTAAAHGLIAGDKAVLTSCATSALNGTWTIATVPLTTTFTVTGTGSNNASSASCVLQSFKVLTTATFYVSGVVIINNSTSDQTVNVRDGSTNCASAPCRVGLARDITVFAKNTYSVPLPYTSAGSGVLISGSVASDLEYHIVGTY